MKSDPFTPSDDLPVYDEETDTRFSIEVIASLAGVNATTVLRYHEQGFIHPVAYDTRHEVLFGVESLRQLRRIRHLRESCDMNDASLKLILDLLHEIECLHEERRQMLR